MVKTFKFPTDIYHKARQLFNIAYSTKKFYAVHTKNKTILGGKCIKPIIFLNVTTFKLHNAFHQSFSIGYCLRDHMLWS